MSIEKVKSLSNCEDWRPTASMETLRARAELLAAIRQFFAARGVQEVETPLMATTAVTDPFIDAFEIKLGAGAEVRYLQTSPEYAMKRLLAAGSGPIYQICKAFRREEGSSRHNPEFTMLEWYRPGFDERTLMDEVQALLASLLHVTEFRRLSYREVFDSAVGVDPHRSTAAELASIARQYAEFSFADDALDRDGWLDVLMTHVIEPSLDPQHGVFIYDYPASQAALAQVQEDESGQQVARRFEFYCGGVELSNGYYELLDAEELARRGNADNAKRSGLNRPEIALDRRLLAAMQAGLPSSAGVSIGVDRLLMIQRGLARISEGLSFDIGNA
ncbi:EF-P lysine aminoacylase EpmA [Sinobacterium caligoides]|uniref:EF-P lysine aminoacylase EpmA n=1 Tax=Sinobacterium caligoides TaxID=933926 RepID=UPI001FE45661|nr:EF-P lysine aminoacylase EpmA [Sinobacterium caligoides]